MLMCSSLYGFPKWTGLTPAWPASSHCCSCRDQTKPRFHLPHRLSHPEELMSYSRTSTMRTPLVLSKVSLPWRLPLYFWLIRKCKLVSLSAMKACSRVLPCCILARKTNQMLINTVCTNAITMSSYWIHEQWWTILHTSVCLIQYQRDQRIVCFTEQQGVHIRKYVYVLIVLQLGHVMYQQWLLLGGVCSTVLSWKCVCLFSQWKYVS